MKESNRKQQALKGATFVEFALVCLVLILFLLALVEWSRLHFAKSILLKGAQIGLNYAENSQEFAFDLENLTMSATDYSTKANSFFDARQRIMRAALEVPQATLFSEVESRTSPGKTDRFVGAEYSDTLRDGSVRRQYGSVLLLRPGDSVFYGEEWVDHPDCCSRKSPTCPPEKQRAGQTLQSLLQDFPIIVEIRAPISSFFPGLPNFTLKARAAGYKEDLMLVSARSLPAMPLTPTTATTTSTSTSTTTSTTTTLAPGASTTSTSTSTTSTTVACPDPDPGHCERLYLKYWNSKFCRCENYEDVGS